MIRRLALTLMVIASGCGGEADVVPMTLHLIDDAPACLLVQVGMVRSVELVAVGSGAGGADCQLARACIEVDPTSSVPGLEDQLAAAPQPALDVETERLGSVRLRGFDTTGCEGTVQLCGIADVDAEIDGELDIPVVCDGRVTARCPSTPLTACP